MGIWGAGIFCDDVAEDVREEYRLLVGDGVEDAEATRRILEEYLAEPDEAPVVWLALAATQSALGRLEEGVKDKALTLIEDGTAVGPWLDGPSQDLRARKAALTRLRNRLIGPQPERKTVGREWRPSTDLDSGDVLSWRCPNGRLRLVRVVTVEGGRNGSFPMLELLAGVHDQAPAGEVLNDLPGGSITKFGPTRHGTPRRWWAYPFHYGEPNWQKAGFTRVGKINRRPGDEKIRSRDHVSWPRLGEELNELPNGDVSSS